MRPVIKGLILFMFLASCSYQQRRVLVSQTQSGVGSDQQSMETLVTREKQSLKIALLQIEHHSNAELSGGSIIIEGRSLVYRMFDGDEESNHEFLPEAYRLMSLATQKKIAVIVMSQNKAEELWLRQIYKRPEFAKLKMSFVRGFDATALSHLRPILVICEDYESLWPSDMSSENRTQKAKWFSHWVDLPNSKRQRLSARHWAKYFSSDNTKF